MLKSFSVVVQAANASTAAKAKLTFNISSSTVTGKNSITYLHFKISCPHLLKKQAIKGYAQSGIM
ncbi:hypothetical protein GCM10008943_28680 [Paenochrobactrum glaciei]|uniref:Uncharacterized protein n=1 Tax=Paenochrobactrum glaciei TaxID=486407 RepID=A0ABP3RJ52_9HYPH